MKIITKFDITQEPVIVSSPDCKDLYDKKEIKDDIGFDFDTFNSFTDEEQCDPFLYLSCYVYDKKKYSITMLGGRCMLIGGYK